MGEALDHLSRQWSRDLSEALARTLRHEIGDFLQKVYASVAVLQTRLPPQCDLEREVLARLRRHAENCKQLVEEMQDYLCAITLNRQQVDLARLAAGLMPSAQKEYPHLHISAKAASPAPVSADPERMTQVGRFLLDNACEAAEHQVQFRTVVQASAKSVEWVVTNDGPGIAADLAGRLFTPFFTTRPGHAGLGLTLARKFVLLHGGQLVAGNLPQGGFEARVILPASEPEPEP
jgi:two-component system sensor histidine kinase DctS